MVRRASLLSFVLIALAPAPASADVTATYQRPGAVGTAGALTIEVAANGNVRAGNDDSGYYLWTNGQGYEVKPGPGGPTVIRTADTAAALAGVRSTSEIMQPWLPVDSVSINGRKGTRYFINGRRHNPGAAALVISRDPSLAMLAAGHRRFESMQASSSPGTDSPESVSFRRLLARGLWIAGGDGLYAVTANHPIIFRKMPPFQRIDGVDISWTVPGLVLVRTDVDAHVSVGGGTPLLVAR